MPSSITFWGEKKHVANILMVFFLIIMHIYTINNIRYISSNNTFYNVRKWFYPHYDLVIMVTKLQDGIFLLCIGTKTGRTHHFTTRKFQFSSTLKCNILLGYIRELVWHRSWDQTTQLPGLDKTWHDTNVYFWDPRDSGPGTTTATNQWTSPQDYGTSPVMARVLV